MKTTRRTGQGVDMRNAMKISQELAAAREQVTALESELRAATTVAYLAVFDTDSAHSIVPVSSALPTRHPRFEIGWDDQKESAWLEWDRESMAQYIGLDETEEWYEDNLVLLHLSETREAAERWIQHKLRNS